MKKFLKTFGRFLGQVLAAGAVGSVLLFFSMVAMALLIHFFGIPAEPNLFTGGR